MQKSASAPARASPAMPPMTPPAIGPARLFFFGAGVGVGVGVAVAMELEEVVTAS